MVSEVAGMILEREEAKKEAEVLRHAVARAENETRKIQIVVREKSEKIEMLNVEASGLQSLLKKSNDDLTKQKQRVDTFTKNQDRRQKEVSTAQRQLHYLQDSFNKAKKEDAAKAKARVTVKSKMMKPLK